MRTKTAELIATLLSGGKIDLVHRSRIIGKIVPEQHRPKIFTKKDLEYLKQLIRKMNFPKFSQKQMEKNYREHMMKKYGKNLPRR